MSPEEENKPAEATDDVHVIPPPMPAEEAGRYSVSRDPFAEDDIASYVEGQARDEEVKHVEKIKTEYALGEQYDIWDVTTDKNRWWVITNLTNLYSQKYFPSLDYTLSFHIGLMRRMLEGQPREVEDTAPFEEVDRRQRQAHDQLDRAVEAEQYQAVGMQLRECLVALVTGMRRRVDVAVDGEAPKAADFVGWSDVLLNRLCPGEANQMLRSYLKGVAKQSWQLVNWLTHAKNANQTAASISVHSCDTIIGHFIQILVRDRTDHTEACPKCSSREIRSHFDINIPPDGAYFSSCGKCGWDSYPAEVAEES